MRKVIFAVPVVRAVVSSLTATIRACGLVVRASRAISLARILTVVPSGRSIGTYSSPLRPPLWLESPVMVGMSGSYKQCAAGAGQ